jgi:putative glutamine amidotransferase
MVSSDKNKEKKTKKIYCSHGHTTEANWIRTLPGFDLTDNIKEADVVVFGGGTDINPNIYRENKNNKTQHSDKIRDAAELADFALAQTLGIKCVGVCRGAQLLCALSGGKLIQHVTGHSGAGDHAVTTYDDKKYTVNSLHHQMMYPYTLSSKDYTMIAWSSKNLSSTYQGGNNKELWVSDKFQEPEVIHFKNTDSLAIQWHPEMMFRGAGMNGSAIQWIQLIFSKFYNNEL